MGLGNQPPTPIPHPPSPKMLVDYHTHTSFSADSNAAMEDQCRAAIKRGVKQIAFTEHEDYNPDDPTSFYFQHEEYWKEIQRCRALFDGQLIVRAAIEISEPHRHKQKTADILAKYPWDYALGSLHWVDQKHNTYLPEFFTKFGDWRKSWRLYFDELTELASEGEFDVMSHIDYPARYGGEVYGDGYDIRDYEGQVRETLKTLIKRGKGIEINTSAWRRGLPNPNPPAIVVKWYRELGGEVLAIGTDSHAPKDTGTDFARAADIARAAGFTQIATFERRRAGFVEI